MPGGHTQVLKREGGWGQVVVTILKTSQKVVFGSNMWLFHS